ncbi:MauE/DoxX family redox-associated membrane protein [Yinghuangia seranimata]|uniref:MauE/DoxX family redox-associated membrane protein n=1 Tax=Yinghuangia seranimata TaxID=408067 RepID=UPI00248AD3E3|nr:MauE/DoxX family redox-associated membrane protein [Yinghuangia seranimata]MDI2131067.1 hypothetical protein [Yinghuangia seranimata]
MDSADWLLTLIDALVIAVLVQAGAVKLVSPAAGAAAVAELVPRGRGMPPPTAAVRALAVAELAAGIAAAVPQLRVADRALVIILGLVFAAAGVLGALRGSSEPCGCFGAASSRPLGAGNVLMGLALAAVAGANLAFRGGMSSDEAAATALSGVVVLMVWQFVAVRAEARVVVGELLRQRVRQSAQRSEVSG